MALAIIAKLCHSKYASFIGEGYWSNFKSCQKRNQVGCRDRAGGGAGGALAPPTFLAVDVRTLNVQREIFKVLMKDGEFTCFEDILAKIKQLSEAVKCMITEIITLCKLLLVNPATSAAGERSFSSARRLKTLSLIHIWRCRRIERCRSRWSPYH